MYQIDLRRCIGLLLQFKFKNFKSFSDENIINMMATNIKEHVDSLIVVNGNKILPVAAVYGANASGKSNIFLAFSSMCYDVLNYSNENYKHTRITPYIFNEDKRQSPSEFEVSINVEEKEYRYGFSRNQEKVIEEWLYEKKFSTDKRIIEKLVYIRINDKIEIGKIKLSEKNEIEFLNTVTNGSELIMSNLGKRNISKYTKVYNWFETKALRQNFSNDNDELFVKDYMTEFCYSNKTFLEKISILLQTFDNSIIGLKIKEEQDSNLNKKYVIYSQHKCDNDTIIDIPFDSESSGTKKLYAIAAYIFIGINNGGVLFIDELDAKLHPLILRYIIQLFSDPKTNIGKGQLIFSSHNLICLDSSDMRRDEIWFVEKNNQISNLYSLYDFKEENDTSIRSDMNFGKNYLSGRFGAIPFRE